MGLFSLLPVLGILLERLGHGRAVLDERAAAVAPHAGTALDPGQAAVAALLLVLSIRLIRHARRR